MSTCRISLKKCFSRMYVCYIHVLCTCTKAISLTFYNCVFQVNVILDDAFSPVIYGSADELKQCYESLPVVFILDSIRYRWYKDNEEEILQLIRCPDECTIEVRPNARKGADILITAGSRAAAFDILMTLISEVKKGFQHPLTNQHVKIKSLVSLMHYRTNSS